MDILEVIDYIESLGFIETPCRLPIDNINSFKRDLYVYLYEKYPNIYKIVSKISPVKFRKVRNDWSLIFKKDKYEICLKPIKDFTVILNGYSYENYGSENYEYFIGNIDQNEEKIQLSYMTYLDQVKNKKDWVIKYYTDSKIPLHESTPAWWKGPPYEIVFNIDMNDHDQIKDNIEIYLNRFPELKGTILQINREKKINQII